MQDGAKAAAEAVRREFDASAAQLAAPIREARRVSMLNMVAAGMAVLAAAPGPVGLAVDGDAGSHRQKWRWSTAPAASPELARLASPLHRRVTVLQDAASGGPASPETARLEKKPGSAGLLFYTGGDRPKDCDRPGRSSWACFRSCSCLRMQRLVPALRLAHGIPIGSQLGFLGAHLARRQLFDLGRSGCPCLP
jgi:hypothetical protein